MLRLLAIHEGVPGHYLQGAYANRTPSLARAVFGSGMFAEGWAVYVTQVLMDLGYGDHEPALLLTHWKFYLRAIINALIDVAIHTAGMTEDEAIELMVDGGFQEAGRGARPSTCARGLTSTQLSHLLPGLARDVGPRGGGASSGGSRGRRRADIGARAAHLPVAWARRPGSTIAHISRRSSRTAHRRSSGSARLLFG